MTLISIDDLKPDMTLACDLRTRQGRLLLTSGSKITVEHIKIARIWGISEADVVLEPGDEAVQDPLENIDPELKKVLDALSGWRFAWCSRELAVIKMLIKLFQRRAALILSRDNLREVVERFRGPKIIGDVKSAGNETEHKPDIHEIVRKEVGLVSLPDVFNEILEVLNSPTSSASHISEVISKDTSLSSRLLRLVNSSFYSFMSRIDTLSRAVTIFGTVEITNLAMGISVTSMFRNIPDDLVNMRDFWEHSIAVGVVARILAAQTGGSGLEKVFVGGLLHDIGRLIFLRNYPYLTSRMILLASSHPYTLHQLEQKHFKFSHGELGGALLKEWNIPQSLQDMVSHHHSPGSAAGSMEVLLIHVADIIVHSLGFGHSGSRRVPPLTDNIWKKTGLSLNVLPTVVSQAQNQLRDLKRIMIPEKADAV